VVGVTNVLVQAGVPGWRLHPVGVRRLGDSAAPGAAAGKPALPVDGPGVRVAAAAFVASGALALLGGFLQGSATVPMSADGAGCGGRDSPASRWPGSLSPFAVLLAAYGLQQRSGASPAVI